MLEANDRILYRRTAGQGDSNHSLRSRPITD
jgi:hypothetical protein